jgi:hypothetical protein
LIDLYQKSNPEWNAKKATIAPVVAQHLLQSIDKTSFLKDLNSVVGKTKEAGWETKAQEFA